MNETVTGYTKAAATEMKMLGGLIEGSYLVSCPIIDRRPGWKSPDGDSGSDIVGGQRKVATADGWRHQPLISWARTNLVSVIIAKLITTINAV